MAGIDQSTLWRFANMILGRGKRDTTTREQATFLRTDQDGTQWVRLNGSSDETPVNGRTLASAKAGDIVEWSIDDGRLSITGNATTPAVGSNYVDGEVNVVVKQVDAIRTEVVETAELVADKASVGQLEAESARIDELEADHVSVSDFEAEQANIDSLQAATADIDTIRANSAKVQNLTAAQLEADHATIGTLDTTYMHADMANADVAWIQNGTIKNGAIVSAMINDVSANKLTAGTINGSVINVTNLNADNITTGTINGQRIGEGSLSLDKLSEDVYTEAEVNTIVDGLNDRIDGAIETHTGTAVPTLNNSPASAWNTTALRDEHVGDVYYVVNSQSQQNGYCYRFTKSGSTYSWQLIKDSDVTAALSRLTTAEGKITTFDSDISQLKTDTGTLTTKTTSLETRMSDAESDILDKVDTTTFNSLEDTVDGHTQTLSQHTTAISNKADSSTVTAVTNRVSKNEQDISGINTTIGELQETVESKADGSTVSTISNRLNTVSDTVDGHTQTISGQSTILSNNGLTSSTNITNRVSSVEQDLSGYKTTVSETYATQTALATTNGNVTAAQTAADNAQAAADRANGRQVAYSATSSTGASTAAKVAACTNFPALAAGATVTVRFSAANTSTGAVTLNVNSTGAKTVYVNGAATSSSNQLLWGANANITFTYDGSYWRVDSEPRTWYGTGTVAAATAAKTATINEVVICKGTTVVLNMTYENTSTSATLNVTSTGAKNIYYGTTTTRPTTANGYGWSAGSTVSLTFDGQYWRIGDTTALARLTAAESTISSHTTSISQNASAIALKADSSTTYTKTDVDGLISTEVTNRNAAITAKANEITSSVSETYATKSSVNSKADASDVTALAGRVTTAESNITQNAQNIELKVSESDVTGNYIVGKINLNSTTASIAAQHINLQGAVTISDLASDAQNATLNSNISVGGRNLLLHSESKITGTGSISSNGYALSETIKKGTQVVISVRIDADNVTWAGSGSRRLGVEINQASDGVASGTQYIGVWWGLNGTTDNGAGINYNTTNTGVTTFHGRIWSVHTLSRDFDSYEVQPNRYGIYIQNVSGGTVTVSKPKIEIGNKVTDWSPAPEDVDSAISDAAKTATSYVTDITGQNGIMVHPSTDDDTGVRITSDVDIMRDGNSVLNVGTQGDTTSTDAGVTIYDGTASKNVVASFDSDEVSLGANSSSSTIDMCGGVFTFGVDNSDNTSPVASIKVDANAASGVTTLPKLELLAGSGSDECGIDIVGIGSDQYPVHVISAGWTVAKFGGLGMATHALSLYGIGSEEGASVDAYYGIYMTTQTGTNFWSTVPGTVLWSGGYYMTSSHTANLAYNVSTCHSGIVLHFQPYTSSTVQNYFHQYCFVPKTTVTANAGAVHNFTLCNSGFAKVGMKALRIYDNRIVGDDSNDDTGAASGITFDNKYWVLTQVIAV